jgi:beta-galactosidase
MNRLFNAMKLISRMVLMLIFLFLIHPETNCQIIYKLNIDKQLALKSYVVSISGKRHIIFSDALVLQRGDLFDLQSTGQNSFDLSVYPKIESTPKLSYGTIIRKKDSQTILSTFRIDLPTQTVDLPVQTIQQNKFMVTLPAAKPSELNDLYLVIDYTGDTGMGSLNTRP